jgi:hypothetical protein
MHAFTLFVMFDEPGEEFLQWSLKWAAQYFVLILLMCAGCFCTRSPSETPKDRNPVVIDPGIKGAPLLKSFFLVRFLEFFA